MKTGDIAAISTGLTASGVAVIRISGENALSIAEKMFFPTAKVNVRDFEPNKLYPGEIKTGEFEDYGMCVFFKAPKSFTGENTVEFHTHGGVAITRGVLQAALKNGARLAENGEFTKRAFMNGKLSLSSAEGLIDMINSETQSAVKAGYYLYREKLTERINAMQDKLTDALAEIEADMDYPEEDLSADAASAASKAVVGVTADIEFLLSTFNRGSKLKNGVRVSIVGKPNTGKSSLLNALIDYDKAIVSDVAGTTRDVVEASLNINGVRFDFSDTAGIRESSDKIENMGINLSKKTAEASDIIVLVTDGTESGEDEELYRKFKDKNLLVVSNKSDLNAIPIKGADIVLSAKTGDNVERLKQMIFERTVGRGIDINGDFLCEERHFEALNKALSYIKPLTLRLDDIPLDAVASDIKNCWTTLGEITGKTASEEVIDRIFAKFCVGK